MSGITKSTKPVSSKNIKRSWHIIDLKDKVLGRSVAEVVDLLQGKSKRDYVPYLDCGDNVVLINSNYIKTTGKKGAQKIYDSYSGYQGGRKTLTLDQMMERDSTKVVRLAVSGMLPKNKHRDLRLARLFIFKDENHPFENKFNKK